MATPSKFAGRLNVDPNGTSVFSLMLNCWIVLEREFRTMIVPCVTTGPPSPPFGLELHALATTATAVATGTAHRLLAIMFSLKGLLVP
jgi:hypothetical protein